MEQPYTELRQHLTRTTGNDDFLNSGVIETNYLNLGSEGSKGFELNLLLIGRLPYKLQELIQPPGQRAVLNSRLVMPDRADTTAPHFHRWEYTIVGEGTFFDAGPDGEPGIGLDGEKLIYKAGDIVINFDWSIHTPWSGTGGTLAYYQPNGLISLNREGMIPHGMSLQDATEKTIEVAVEQDIPQLPLKFAIDTMVADVAKRAELTKKFITQ